MTQNTPVLSFEPAAETAAQWYLYMLRTADNRLYTGITTNVERRLKQHQAGKGAKALRNSETLALAYHIQVGNHSSALKLEYRIKQLTKVQKERLVKNQPSINQLMEQFEL